MMWRSIPLAQVARAFISGGTPDTKKQSLWEGPIPWITGADVVDGHAVIGRRHIAQAALVESATNIVPKSGILLVTRTGVGKIAIAEEDTAISQDLTGIVVGDAFLPNFVMWAIRSRIASLVALQRGATIKGVLRRDVEQIPIPHVAKSEQRRITETLEQADLLRKKRTLADEASARIYPALFHKLFGDPISNDRNWPTGRFNSIAESRLGKMLDSKRQTGLHKRPYLRNLNVQWARLDLADLLQMDFDENDRKEFRLQRGDLLVCEGGEVGRAAIWREELPECYFQKAIHRVRPHQDKCTPEYLLHLLWAMAKRNALVDVNSKATIPHLTGVQLAALRIILPPLPVQQTFTRLVNVVDEIQERQRQAKLTLDSLFATTLHRAFTGDLTARWRQAHMKELLTEMEQQARLLNLSSPERN